MLTCCTRLMRLLTLAYTLNIRAMWPNDAELFDRVGGACREDCSRWGHMFQMGCVIVGQCAVHPGRQRDGAIAPDKGVLGPALRLGGITDDVKITPSS